MCNCCISAVARAPVTPDTAVAAVAVAAVATTVLTFITTPIRDIFACFIHGTFPLDASTHKYLHSKTNTPTSQH